MKKTAVFLNIAVFSFCPVIHSRTFRHFY